ncbi:solute carrier family 25 member 35-like [Photinus pyralis]|uniref:Solute carrier family 25 member 35 n=1 Tax=Photinus pyralis TaxID=7054 RepID=A0A1Y1N403_PHOPY|nr:solute carrier family 25 member 35-like [Photinus pyralis]
MDFVIAGTSAVSAGFFTHPLEVLKIRVQLQGELRKRGQHAVHYKNLFHAGYVVAKTEGILALQKGLVAGLWVQLIMNGLRLGAYQLADSHGYVRDNDGNLIFYKNVLFGGLGGTFGHYFASPFFMIKTHFQSQASQSIAVGYQHNHKGTWQALKTIFKEHGIKGLFRGAGASIPRAFVASTSQLTAFTYSKEFLTKRNVLNNHPYLKSFVSSMVGGVAISTMVTPFDLILTRLYNQGVDSEGRGLLYKNYTDCVVKIYKSEGLLGFSKGLSGNYFRLGPHTVLCLMFWDYYKDLYGRFRAKHRQQVNV